MNLFDLDTNTYFISGVLVISLATYFSNILSFQPVIESILAHLKLLYKENCLKVSPHTQFYNKYNKDEEETYNSNKKLENSRNNTTNFIMEEYLENTYSEVTESHSYVSSHNPLELNEQQEVYTHLLENFFTEEDKHKHKSGNVIQGNNKYKTKENEPKSEKKKSNKILKQHKNKRYSNLHEHHSQHFSHKMIIDKIKIECLNFIYSEFRIMFLFAISIIILLTIVWYLRIVDNSISDINTDINNLNNNSINNQLSNIFHNSITPSFINLLLGILFSFSISILIIHKSSKSIDCIIQSLYCEHFISDDNNKQINYKHSSNKVKFKSNNKDKNRNYEHIFQNALSKIREKGALFILIGESANFSLLIYLLITFSFLILTITWSFFYSYEIVFNSLCFFGIGCSYSAYFSRIAGGIFTKGADISCDIITKNSRFNFDIENDRYNPASLADNIGDLIGDLLGSILDLVASSMEIFAAFTIVFYNIFTNNQEEGLFLIKHSFTLIMSGILIFITQEILSKIINSETINSDIKLDLVNDEYNEYVELIEPDTLNNKLSFDHTKESAENHLMMRFQIQSILVSLYVIIHILIVMPDIETNNNIFTKTDICLNILIGVLVGYCISYSTYYFTSQHFNTIHVLSQTALLSPGVNVIYGLAVGNYSTIFPCCIISAAIFLCHYLSGIMGLAFMTIGIMLLLPCIIQFQYFGPNADVCLGVNNMLNSDKIIIDEINKLDIAGNTISAIVKGFSTGLSAIVSFSLFGAIILITDLNEINLHDISSIVFLMFGGLFCYIVMSYCIKATGDNADNLIKQSIAQIRSNIDIKEVMRNKDDINPDYLECIQISAEFSFEKALIITSISTLFILLQAFFIGEDSLIPMITGIIITGIPIAISSSNSGSAWDNSKKSLEHNFSKYYKRGSLDSIEEQRRTSLLNANVGDNVGDALKDISGPTITILIKYSAFLTLVIFNYLKTN